MKYASGQKKVYLRIYNYFDTYLLYRMTSSALMNTIQTGWPIKCNLSSCASKGNFCDLREKDLIEGDHNVMIPRMRPSMKLIKSFSRRTVVTMMKLNERL